MNIVVSSREIIKPLSATPRHLSKSSLSFLDQSASTGVNNRLLLFYSAQGDVCQFQNSNMSFRLKKSLSASLTQFHSLAGRFSNDQSIDFTDSGAEYVEARVKAPFLLDQLLSCPNTEELEQLYPPDTTGSKALFSVQATLFDGCGGMVIGVHTSHAIIDASALAKFMHIWAAVSRRGKFLSPTFGFVDVFANEGDIDIKRPLPKILKSAPSLVTKRFSFSNSKIAAITGCCVNPSRTRVQVVCAIIFKCLISVVRSRSSKSILLLRPPMCPPFVPNHVGNLPSSKAEISEAESFRGLVGLLRRTLQKSGTDYLRNMLGEDAILLHDSVKQEMQDQMKNEAYYLEINSCCAFPYYEMDFGWGMPTWAAVFNVNVENLVTLMTSKNGGGIEAWVTLTENDMTKFESAEKAFLDYAHILARI